MQIVEMIAWLGEVWGEDEAMAKHGVSDVAAAETHRCSHLTTFRAAGILARVQAERALLAEYRETVEFYSQPANQNAPAGEVTGLETALKIIASGYAGRPGYDESWRQ